MEYQKPEVVDYGAISQHTFISGGTPHKDTQICTPDKFGDQSCPSASP